MSIRRLLLGGGGGSFVVQRWIPIATLLAYLDGGLTKDAGNPVLSKGSAGQWDDYGVRELSPVIDENGLLVTEPDGLWAYYAGFPDATGAAPWQIGLAKSTDDGATWTRYGSNPVVAPAGSGWYQNDVTQPSVVKLDDGSRVMLAAGRNSSDVDSIGCLSSADGLTWVDEGQKLVLADFNDGGATLTEIGVPSLIHRNAGDWLMLCEVLSNSATSAWRIYGATASDPTGTWTPLNSGAPLMGPTGAGWEGRGVANPHVIENTAGHYALIYNGIAASPLKWQVGFAYGSDLTNLTRYSGNPIVSKGAPGQWDDDQTEASFLPKEPSRGNLRLWYQGFDDADGSMQIGLAET